MDWKSTSSALATLMFLRTLPSLLPPEVRDLLSYLSKRLLHSGDKTVSMVVDEFDCNGRCNPLFTTIESYLSSKSASSAKVMKMNQHSKSRALTFSMGPDQDLLDHFNGFQLKWSSKSDKHKHPNDTFSEHRSITLSFDVKHREAVQSVYLPKVLREAEAIRFKNREKRLFSNRKDAHWTSVPFSHPSTFETLALESKVKEDIMSDLTNFVARKEYYRRVGRTWKRGYLLYGPPGTGKTSLIGAIANFLDFDVYDLELTAVADNTQLRTLLLSTASKSVIVVEDVDCTVDVMNRSRGLKRTHDEMEEEPVVAASAAVTAVSLSGILNFLDGLWSTCEGERLMVFTTNHVERLDPALLRPGRMDMHVHMSYCGAEAFRTLMKNYLGVGDHALLAEAEGLLPSAKMTPADVADVLMGCGDDVELGMRDVVERMKRRRIEVAADAEVVNGNKGTEKEEQIVF
ncbi:hypothetical protein QJS04_geneDACA004056 [Acorus gramineus]|uniref:AAA+ ATPase domain-containing protein n=1 Tax=Acorus gramineus TaxID=55184 RepID=A0AAV9BID4_ACOGR|nr:hypothetical protein QJS04_geneDACA004056 [Acorus gramineus]